MLCNSFLALESCVAANSHEKAHSRAMIGVPVEVASASLT
jgi:hypothetical protein